MVHRLAIEDLVQHFASTDRAYTAADERLAAYTKHTSDWLGIDAAIRARMKAGVDRERLYEIANAGYAQVPVSALVRDNLEKLRRENTFVVTTAHQPCLMGGPLYFIYKALSVISLCKELEVRYPHLHFVPIYWLGSEDHDFEEINHFWVLGRMYEWAKPAGGATGKLSLGGVQPILDELEAQLGRFGQTGSDLITLLHYAYSADNLETATVRLLHGLLGNYGLIVFVGNSALGKRAFTAVMADDIQRNTAYRLVNNTIDSLEQLGFRAQARPREINVFYMQAGSRERIVRSKDTEGFEVINSPKRWTTHEELLTELEHSPELFSPNVILRPLYQELLLPSIAYVGGGGELAYWLERKLLFQHYQIPMPVLVRRHSVLLIDRHTLQKMDKLNVSVNDIWLDIDTLTKQYVARQSPETTDFSTEMDMLQKLEQLLAEKAAQADASLEKAVYAEWSKVRNTVEQLTSKILKAEKRKNETSLLQLASVKNKLFPNGNLQERTDNFIEYFLNYGGGCVLWDTLLAAMKPLTPEMLTVTSEQ